MLAASFLRFYGHDVYRNPAWPTRDHVIPFRLFFALKRAMGPVAAAEQFRSYYATTLAVANAWAGSDEAKDSVNDAVEALRAQAFPAIR